MPKFPLIDAHLHLWDPQELRMAWVDSDETLRQRYDLTVYEQHTQHVNVEGMVYVEVGVEAPYSFIEAKRLVELAQHEPRLLGVVAHAPVEYGEHVRTYLQELVALGPLVKGVRRIVQSEEDAYFCAQPAFVRGVQMLAEYNLSFDICIKHTQLASSIQLVRQCPDTQFILDHIGKPAIKEHLLEPWRAHIQELASYPNVMCKISGLTTEADMGNWTPDDLVPYVEHVLNAFGEDRVIYGGDWPVSLLATSYPRWVETMETLTSHLSEAAQRKFWTDNARRFYCL